LPVSPHGQGAPAQAVGKRRDGHECRDCHGERQRHGYGRHLQGRKADADGRAKRHQQRQQRPHPQPCGQGAVGKLQGETKEVHNPNFSLWLDEMQYPPSKFSCA
jgi:hypothetical protein